MVIEFRRPKTEVRTMADYPPFMNATGLIPKILNKIKEAQTPDRFTQDFLATALTFPGGSAKAFIPLAKRIGLIGSDGVPTDLYKSFRNPDQSKSAMAKAIKQGYKEVFARNEYAHKLDRKQLENLIVELTGMDKGNKTLSAISGTFEALKGFADFDQTPRVVKDDGQVTITTLPVLKKQQENETVGINLACTINLVLPKTDDIAVFNAIFKAIRSNLLNQ
jgi:Family of unknown function (DUF5343)